MTCAICMEVLLNAVQLPCSHVFDAACLQHLTAHTSSAACPLCRSHIPSPLPAVSDELQRRVEAKYPQQVDARRQLKVQSDAVLALYDAASMGLTEAVHSLLEAGVKLNTLSERDGSTALYAAAREGRKTVVEALLAHGADVDTSDKERKAAKLAAMEARVAAYMAQQQAQKDAQ